MVQNNIFKIFLFFLLVAIVSAADSRGSYSVPDLGKRKRQILNAGGGSWDIAIAMLESEHLTTDYVYGDGKTDDSANFGIFKQNFFMLRTSTSQFKKYTSSKSYNVGSILNKRLAMDIKARHESQEFYGAEVWFAGHRNGESGLNNPFTQDITNYKNGVNWIHSQLISKKEYLTDDTRFWIYVVPI
ncbi:hypothetical protein BDF21DRAFT_497346 [Thamnidium elegans]|uniref:Uncharacterized protein n=1 Tax=Thamnidium elegans TaxID=101142 RepID=A0A8H7SJC1_9FUNG|nr:hypothetical protein INT48_004084 [Thamnidium elegans]KAI8059701.1 hypothetical protein BDF21DRAFT_497346 [Thamnidium elegans]